ncbi:MAG: transcriptional repressor LexA [Pseudomonadota bacterium]
MLTKKQRQLLLFIHERMSETGVAPSYDEMKDALNLKSKSGIHRLIGALEERGFIQRMPHRARAIEIKRLPEPVGGASSGGAFGGKAGPPPSREAGFRPSIIEGSLGQRHGEAEGLEEDSEEIPMLGRIAAGTPIEAISHASHVIEFPRSALGHGEHYALEVAGDSMLEAGILDGDIVILERCDTAASGDIVVALVDREEATLKKLHKKGDNVALVPANKAYETRIYGPDRVQIQGRMVALLRYY